uniref:Bromo domain-containing protein n=1 Tax=Globodera pallida TaxID=36090 RepID=A0A183CN00_GLOPA
MDDILGKSGKEETNKQIAQPTNEQKRVTQNDSIANEPKANVKIIPNQRDGGEMLLNKLFSDELSFYLIDEGTESLSADTLSAKAQALASIHLPLFPLARNHKIRGTFPLLDRADDESIASEASIDVSICWKFAYVFDGFEDLKIEEKTPLKKFVPLADKNVPKEEVEREEAQKKQKDAVPELPEQALPGQQQMSKEQKALERIDIKQFEPIETKGGPFSDGSIQSGGSSEDDQSGEEMTEEELRRRLLLMPEPSKIFVGEMENKLETIIQSSSAAGRQASEHKIMLAQENNQVDEARAKEAGQSRISEPISVVASPKSSSSSATVIIDAEKTLERTTSDEISEDLLKEGSSSEAEAENDEQEEDEDARSIRSDATYTAEGPLGPIEMDEPQAERIEQPDEEMMGVLRNVDNLSVAVLEVGVAYSANLLEYMREAMHGIMDEKDDDGGEGEDGELFEQIVASR